MGQSLLLTGSPDRLLPHSQHPGSMPHTSAREGDHSEIRERTNFTSQPDSPLLKDTILWLSFKALPFHRNN